MKKILLIFIAIIMITNNNVQASNTIDEQKEQFGINEFINQANEYSKSDFFEGLDIREIMDNAINGEVDNKSIYKRFLNLLGKEVKTTIISLTSILAIIVIHSILKAISDNLDNSGVSKLVYYVQYILIVTVIMKNVSDVVKIVQDATSNLINFMNLLVPLLIELMLFTGNITTSSVLEPIILFMINFLGNIIHKIIIPIVLVVVSFCVISKLSDKIKIDKIGNFMKSGVVTVLGVLLTIFVGVISLESSLSGSVDAVTAKTTKTIVSSAIPVVGKVLGDAVETVLGCGNILKNAVGIVGIIIVIGICITPLLKLLVIMFSYKLLSALSSPIADEKIVSLLEQMSDIFKIFFAILSAIVVMLIVGLAIVMKVSNI